MICIYPQPLKVVRFVENSLLFNQLNISRADMPCVLENASGRSTQTVTLYITINITPPDSYNSSSSIPTEGDDSPAEEATTPGPIQFPTPEHHLPPSHHQRVETENTPPQSREEVSPTSTTNPRSALDSADEALNRLVPIDRSKSWERALGKIKWVMDTLGPIAEVRVIPFSCPWLC